MNIWVDGSYKYVVQDASGVVVSTTDNVTSFSAGGANSIDINGLIETTGGAFNDYLPLYDTSATANRKISFANILGLLPSLISGLLPSAVSGTNTTATLTISPGSATASNATTIIQGAGYTWNVSNGNNINGYQGGVTLPNSATIHFFVIMGNSGVASFASTSLTPTLPTGYELAYRRIFSLQTSATGALLPVVCLEGEGGSLITYLVSTVLESVTNISTTATLVTLTVPKDIKVQHLGRYQAANNSIAVILSSPDETDVAPGNTPLAADLSSNTNYNLGVASTYLTTNTLSQIRARATSSSNFSVVTRGWKDFRR